MALRTFAALLVVVVVGVGATRDIVCQLGCGPDTAHAAACHEPGDLGGTMLEASANHCLTLDPLATTAIKVGAVKDQRPALSTTPNSTVESQTLASPARLDLVSHSCSSRARCRSVLRI